MQTKLDAMVTLKSPCTDATIAVLASLKVSVRTTVAILANAPLSAADLTFLHAIFTLLIVIVAILDVLLKAITSALGTSVQQACSSLPIIGIIALVTSIINTLQQVVVSFYLGIVREILFYFISF